MVVNLPLEIIEQIVYFLSKKSTIECLITCRRWYVHLYRVLVRSVTIYSKRQLKQFLNVVTIHNDLTGPFVREFYVKNHVGITYEVFEQLGKLCPNIEILKFRNWRHYKSSVLRNFKNIKQLPAISHRNKGKYALLETGDTLTHLEMTSRVVRELVVQQSLLSFITLCPNLTHLSLDGYHSSNTRLGLLELSFSQLEEIHAKCPHLQSIRLNTVTLAANESDLATMKSLLQHGTVKVEPQMTSYILRFMDLDDPIWISYIAVKYPNLIKLELRFALCTFVDFDEITQKLDALECRKAFMDMARALKCLKVLRLTCLKVPHFPGEVFFDTLAFNGVQLEKLCVRYHTDILSQQGLDLPTLEAITGGQMRTVKELNIDMWVRAHENLYDYLEPLAAFSRLTDLSLSSDDFKKFNFNPIPIDIILNECVHLERLELVRTALTIDDKHTSNRTHSLKKLHIAVSRISEQLFTYLTERCPHITTLEISTSFWMPREMEMKIDMHNNHLEYLRIGDLNKLNVPRLEGNLGNGTSVNIVAVTQFDKIQKKADRYRKRDCHTVPSEANCTDYYHLYEIDDGRLRFPPCSIRKLHSNEVNSLKYLIQHYIETYHQDHMGLNGYMIDRYVPKKLWRDDVQYGYVHIKCKSLETLKYNFTVIQYNSN